MRKLFSLLLVTILVAGCSTLFAPVAEKIASSVERYCEEPYSYRSIYRNTVNSNLVISGHKVHVHCSGDPNDPVQPADSSGAD